MNVMQTLTHASIHACGTCRHVCAWQSPHAGRCPSGLSVAPPSGAPPRWGEAARAPAASRRLLNTATRGMPLPCLRYNLPSAGTPRDPAPFNTPTWVSLIQGLLSTCCPLLRVSSKLSRRAGRRGAGTALSFLVICDECLTFLARHFEVALSCWDRFGLVSRSSQDPI